MLERKKRFSRKRVRSVEKDSGMSEWNGMEYSTVRRIEKNIVPK
jgi:hypothetical protein